MLLNTSELACKREDSDCGSTSADIITINVSPVITKLHFIITCLWLIPLQPIDISESPTLIIRDRNVSLEDFAVTEFNEIFLGRKEGQNVKGFRRFGS
jgi:hypothetical protein